MPMPRSYFMKRTTLGLALLGVMTLATGCDSGSGPVTPTADTKAQVNNMRDAMQKQNEISTKKAPEGRERTGSCRGSSADRKGVSLVLVRGLQRGDRVALRLGVVRRSGVAGRLDGRRRSLIAPAVPDRPVDGRPRADC